MKKRYAFMDVIRVVSMFGIVYYHMVIALYLCGIRQYESLSPLFENSNMHIATVGVGLFFMISGAGLMLSTGHKGKLDLKNYYFKRFTKILIPFYLVYVLFLITFLLLTGQGLDAVYTSHASPLAIIYTLLGMDAYVASFGISTFSLGIGEWFLGALVMMYIIFPLLRFGLIKNKYLTLLIMSIYYIIILIVYPLFPFADKVPGFVNFLCKVYEFFLGMFFIEIIDHIPQKLELGISIPVILFFLIYPAPLPFNQNLIILIENVAFFLLFMGLEKAFNKIPHVIKVLTFLCGYTYEFFLLHHKCIDYITLQHIGVPFSNRDILLLFIKELAVISVLTFIVKQLLSLPGYILKRKTRKTSGTN